MKNGGFVKNSESVYVSVHSYVLLCLCMYNEYTTRVCMFLIFSEERLWDSDGQTGIHLRSNHIACELVL